MNGSIILTETLRELRYGTRRITHQGGQSSGKTVNILGALAVLASEETSGVTTVTAKSFPILKGGAIRDFEMFVYPTFKNAISSYHKTDHLFTFKSGSQIEFRVFQTEQDARGAKRKRLLVNEANSFEWLTFYQLDSRSEQSIIDYNPSIRFWAHEKINGLPDTRFFRSWHEHNPFLSKQKHREMENNPDAELWKVYARGLTGNVMGLIFPNWIQIEDCDFPDIDCIWGIDFGFTNDPTALVKICRVGNTVFLHECLYKPGASPEEIKSALISNGYREDQPLFCEHEPNMVKLLRLIGGITCLPANKGAGSINAGIEMLKKMKVCYTSSSRNIKLEISQYIWLIDKQGNTTNTPVDRMNHILDATRYGCYTSWIRR